MTDTTNNDNNEINDESVPVDIPAVQLSDGRVLTVADLIKVYEEMDEAQKTAVHYLVNAAQNGEIEVEPDEVDEEAEKAKLEEEVEGLHKLSDTLDKAKGGSDA